MKITKLKRAEEQQVPHKIEGSSCIHFFIFCSVFFHASFFFRMHVCCVSSSETVIVSINHPLMHVRGAS